MPVRVITADRHRRNHLAGLRAAVDDDAGERRADLVLVEHRGAAPGVDAGGLELRLRLAQLRAEHADPRLRLGQVGLGGEILLRQRLHPRHDPRRVFQIGGDGRNRGIGALGARAGQLIILFGEHAVEPRDHLALGHRHAFVDEDLDHLAGDLGRNRRLAPRHHVAGGRERAGRLAARSGLRRGGLRLRRLRLRGGLLVTVSLGGSCLAELEGGKGGESDDAGDNRRPRSAASFYRIAPPCRRCDRSSAISAILLLSSVIVHSIRRLAAVPARAASSRADGLAHSRSTCLAIDRACPQAFGEAATPARLRIPLSSRGRQGGARFSTRRIGGI